jgi:ATP-dependent RNA helicase SUPV3L1/SUV3
MLEGSTITAALGPTNTGKTHRAIEQMLSHDSGMIGLPLRLLAREVYDRVTARVGEERVALVTGEEKRVPRRPDYWVCTVEAMPLDREVDFLAVDEIQLAAHAQRGHIFTDRLLRARGRRETWFLGSDTMRRVLAEVTPTARLVENPRLSRLSFAGATRLGKLPPRSAVVAFSTEQVYEIAEKLRAQRGGAAVVLGALSPRTRNAQVAMFQAGEVDVLVATDAIGMGLNLDVRHVAFAALRKFDGRDVRPLDAPELAQIAGRAGRYLDDGTFGTISPLSLSPEVALGIESHHFAPVERLWWRNPDLDFGSIDRLLTSLHDRPRQRVLTLTRSAEDSQALEMLREDDEIRALARGPEAVALLWEVCQIPDFRKLLLENHVGLLREIFLQLASPRGLLDPDWMASRIAEIDDTAGDIEVLIDRIASIRTWTFISNRTRWVRDATAWQERTRLVEDRLSDVLHARLVERFVERGQPARVSRPRSRHAAPRVAEPPAPPSSHPFAGLARMRAAMGPPPEPEPPPRPWVEALIEARHQDLSVDEKGIIHFEEEAAGQLIRGSKLLLPEVKLVEADGLGGGPRSRIQRRLLAFARDLTAGLLAPLRGEGVRHLSDRAAGLVYLLEQGLGTLRNRSIKAQLQVLSASDREALDHLGIELGLRMTYHRFLLAPEAVALRVLLCRTFLFPAPAPRPPASDAPSYEPPPAVERTDHVLIGYPVVGTLAIRADLVERLARALTTGPTDRRPGVDELAGWLECDPKHIPWVVDDLGI